MIVECLRQQRVFMYSNRLQFTGKLREINSSVLIARSLYRGFMIQFIRSGPHGSLSGSASLVSLISLKLFAFSIITLATSSESPGPISKDLLIPKRKCRTIGAFVGNELEKMKQTMTK